MEVSEGDSIGVQVTPSLLPSSVTLFGSLSDASLADVIEIP